MWIGYVKRKLWIATQVSWMKVKVTVAKIENRFLLKNWPNDAKLSVWVVYVKRQLRIPIQVSKVKVTFLK